MPVFFEALPRPDYRQRTATRRFSLLKLFTVNLVVLAALGALWLALPHPANPPKRMATIKLVPVPAETPKAPPATPAGRTAEKPVDRSTTGSLGTPPRSAFREIERAAPENYVGFREIKSAR